MSFEQGLPSPQPERRSSILPNVRLEGVKDPDKQGAFYQENEDRFLNQNSPWLRDVHEYKRLPTPEEIKTIGLVNTWTNALLKRYNAPSIDIPAAATYVLEKQKLPERLKDHLLGRFYPGSYAVTVVEQSGQYPFAESLFHEMLHAKSRMSHQPEAVDADDTIFKRLGISYREKKVPGKFPDLYFNWMNEAVTEELAKTFTQACFKAGMWKAERDQTVATLLEPDIPSDVKSNLSDVFFARPLPQKPKGWFKKTPEESGPKYEIREYSYASERAALKLLIDTLYERNPSQFQSPNQVFDVFARAMLRDTLLPLGRLIERTFGHGTFKKIGAIKDIGELQAIIRQSDSKQTPKNASEKYDSTRVA